MQTLQQTYNPSFVTERRQQSIISQFLLWCKGQEEYRYGWLAVIIALHGCVITPLTVLMIMFGDNSIGLWAMAIGAMAMSLVTNLAAMPTKITIPVFFFSVFIDLVIVAVSLTQMFNS